MIARWRSIVSLGTTAAVLVAACHGSVHAKNAAAAPASGGTATTDTGTRGSAPTQDTSNVAAAPGAAAPPAVAPTSATPAAVKLQERKAASGARSASPTPTSASASTDHTRRPAVEPASAPAASPTAASTSPAPAPATNPAPAPAPASAPRAASADTAPAVSAAAIAAGRGIFHGAGTCFACHGASLEGGPIAPTLRSHPWKDAHGGTLEAIYSVIAHGVPNTAMVAHPGGISDADAHNVAAYVWAVSQGRAKP